MSRRYSPAISTAGLALAQVVAWGVLYYAVLVIAPAISADTGWPEGTVFAAITAGLITSAAGAIPVGRLLDRRPRRVMVAGAIAGSLAILVAAAAPSIWIFAAAWVLCGAAQAAVLYQAAFTVITHRYGARRRGPLTFITLAGGLASTVFAPLTAWLIVEFGWRATFAFLGAVLAAVVVPIYAFTIEHAWERGGGAPPTAGNGGGGVVRSPRFIFLSVTFALMSFSLYAVTLSAVPATVAKGLDLQAAAWALGLIGVGQVLGRLIYLALPHRASPWVAPAVVGLVGAASLVAFGMASGEAGIFFVSVATGAVRGSLTLVQASAVADRWGAESYGRLNGVLAAPVIGLTALAPGVAVIVAGAVGSYDTMAFLMAALCATGGVLAIRR